MKRLLACLAIAALGLPAAAAGASVPPAPADVQQRADHLVTVGNDWPDEALDGLDGLAREAGADAASLRVLKVARGLVAARAGRDAMAEATARELRATAAADPLAGAGAELVLAVQADTRGRFDIAGEHADAAIAIYESQCVAAPREACEHRPWWRAHVVRYTRSLSQGNRVAARAHMAQALEVAQGGGDPFLQVWSHAALAALAAESGEFDLARRQMAQAQRLARLDGSAAAGVRVRLAEARIAAARGDAVAMRHALADALPLAREARSPRTQALVLNNLSDVDVKHGRPAQALAAIEQALPIVRRYGDRRLERTLLHNAGLARIGLGRLGEGRRDFDRMLALWAEGGAEGNQALALREFGDAFAAAGDVRTALELYHRERKLNADIMAANRDTALRELQARYDREAQQRDIELLARDNALKNVQLANGALARRIWIAVAAVLALALSVIVLLYRRVRETNRRLAHSHALLRVQSERDPLTGLANRRHFRDVMDGLGADAAFEGALLLVDIDHFKHVNDGRGHAAGDRVLVEVARRLEAAVRERDLVVRWGGEEFLVFAPGVGADQVDALAVRVLHAIGDAPVGLPDGPLAVTASIGYARFPLPPHAVALSWEQAVNLADMALYTAKSQGRNRAVGITRSQAAHRDALRRVESDFERAWTDGHVALRMTPGPA